MLQICTTPEVYSTLPDGDPGFCFRFARPDDVSELVDGDPVCTQQVIDEVSLYSITLPADDDARAGDGPVGGRTTRPSCDCRLTTAPARRSSSASTSWRHRKVPVMLFLRRLERVTIRRENDGDREERVLTRSRRSVPAVAGDFACDLVTLDGASTYLVLSREVDRGAYRAAVAEAIDHHQLDPQVRRVDVRGQGVCRGAVRGRDAQAGRCYTFLPLGRKAPSPFAGHLNAPFYTDLARRDIDEANPLNRLLLDAAAGLCLDAAEVLTRWQDHAAPAAVIDLLCWDDERLPLLTGYADDHGAPLTGRLLLPARTPGTWLPLKDAWSWPVPGTGMLTADLATSACGVEFLRELPPERSRRLAGMMARLGVAPGTGAVAACSVDGDDAGRDAEQPQSDR